MRLLFMGTPEFALPSLNALVADGHDIAAVITQPDKPRGRGMSLAAPPLKERALALGLPVLQPEKLKAPESLSALSALAPEAIAVVAYGQMIPKSLLELPPYGCVNVHPSLLPHYRGASPIQQALLDGAAETGVTTMYLDEGMDTGDIILQKRVPIDPTEDAGQLHDRLALIGAQLLVETLRRIADGTAPRRAQDNAQATVTRRIRAEDGLLQWDRPARELMNRVRAFTPWPGAYTFMDGQRLKVLQAVAADEAHAAVPGEILRLGDHDDIVVACGEGVLSLRKVQPANSKVMSGAAYARGRRLAGGERFTSAGTGEQS